MRPGLTPLRKLLYGSGDFGFSVTSTMVGAYLSIFLTDVVGLAPALAAAAIFIGRSLDYLNDPVIGHLTDRTRSRWGRRRPYLLFGALPYGASFLLLWLRPQIGNQVLLAAYFGLAYIVYDTAATFAYMPYFALTPELSPNYDDRTSLTTWRATFSIIGSLVVFIVPPALIGSFGPESGPRIFGIAIAFGAASAALLVVVFLSVRERKEYEELPKPRLRESLKAAFANKAFVFGAVVFLATWVCVDLIQALIIYYIKHVVRREALSEVIMGLIFVTALLSLPLWNAISKRWNKRIAYALGAGLLAVCLGILTSFGPETPFIPIAALCVAAGLGVGAAHVLPWAMLPDAVELDELETGVRREGMFYSLITLAQKVASSVAVPLVLLLLAATGYRPAVPGETVAQPERAILGIRLAMSLVPALLLGAGILFALLYPLDRERHGAIVERLEARRKESGGSRAGSGGEGSPGEGPDR